MAFIPDEAIDRMVELSAGAWRLYCFLARCRNQKTGRCFPSVRTTAEAIDVHPKNIFKLRNELAGADWAHFDGDDVTDLFGFDSSKNATTDVEPIEVAPQSSKNTTVRVISSKNTTIGSKNATFESQKHYPVVAKTLLNGSKNATPYKEEPAKEPAKITSKEEPIPGAVAPVDGLSQQQCYVLFVELWQSVGGYDAPYQNQTKDFVQLTKLYKTCEKTNWPLTQEKFTQAATNYFASPQSSHTLADLAARFSEFYKNAHNQYGRPAKANGRADPLNALTPNAQKTAVALEAWLKRGEENEV